MLARRLVHLLSSLWLAWATGSAAPPLCTRPGDPAAWTCFQDCLREVRARQGALPSWLAPTIPLRYTARKPAFDASGLPVRDAAGRQATVPVELTGRVFLPPSWRVHDGSSLPMVVYSHATELQKDRVPSVFGGREWMLGAAAAAWFGFAVVMPDLPGMGGDAAAFHPYCHAASLALAVVDCVPAARRLFGEDPYLREHRLAWDGRLFMLGYSEGGYTTLAAVKEVETHAAAYAASHNVILTGSACMAGPFDLSGAMRATFIDPSRGYPRSYYLPYFVLGYHAVYGPRLEPREVLSALLLSDMGGGGILDWADGSRDGLAVDAEMGARMNRPPDDIPLRQMFNPAWLERELADPAYAASPVHALLAENDLCGGWTPTKPILFLHSPADVNIPYACTRTTVQHLGAAIRAAGGDPGRLLVSLPIGEAGKPVSHADGALLAIPAAFAWFYYGMPAPGAFRQLSW